MNIQSNLFTVVNYEKFDFDTVKQGRKAYIVTTSQQLYQVEVIQISGKDSFAVFSGDAPFGIFNKNGKCISHRSSYTLVMETPPKPHTFLVWYKNEKGIVASELNKFNVVSDEKSIRARYEQIGYNVIRVDRIEGP